MEKETRIKRGNSVLAFKAAFWYTVSSFLTKSVVLITTPIFARLMTVADYGEFSNFANWVITLLIVTSAELHNTLSRAYYDYKDTYDDYISSVTMLGVFITIALYIVFLLGGNNVLRVVSIPKQYVHLLFLFLLVSFCRLVFNARERTLYRYKTVAVITFLSFFVPTLFSVFFVYLIPDASRLSARLYGFYIPSAIIGMYCTISLFRNSQVFEWKYCRYGIALSLPLLMHHLAAYLLTSMNVIVTKSILGAGAAAVVSITVSITHVFSVLSQSISGALTTWLMDNLELKREATVKKGTFYYVLLLSVVVISVILIGPEIIYFLGGAKYVKSVELIPGFIFASFMQSITTIFIVILTYDKNIIKTSIYTAIFAVLSIVVKVWLLPRHGMFMLVYVNIAVFFILFIINYILVKQAGYSYTVPIKGIGMILFATGIVMVVSPQLYVWTMFRYFLIGIFVIICFIVFVRNRAYIKGFVKKFKKNK